MSKKEQKPLPPLLQKLVEKIEEKGLRPVVGLEQQGHIPAIEKRLKEAEINGTSESTIWYIIGEEIGWVPKQAYISYQEYLRSKKKYKFSHIKLTNKDIGTFAAMKTILSRDGGDLYGKMRLAIDAFDRDQCSGIMHDNDKSMLMNGGALMYHLMTDPEFLKESEDIYNQ